MISACAPAPEAAPTPETVLRWQASRVLSQNPEAREDDGGARSFAVTDSLVVATWNVHVGGGDVPGFVADLRSGRLTDGFLPGPFVVLVQEARRTERERDPVPALRPAPGQRVGGRDGAEPRGDIFQVARELDLHVVYSPDTPLGRPHARAPFEDRGVAILSSHPLDAVRAVELPRERQRRVTLAGELTGLTTAGDPWRLLLASIHLENRAGWSRVVDSFGAARGRQARVLAQTLGDGPAVVGGDLNTWAPSFMEPALTILRTAFPDSPEVEGATFQAAGVGRQLDHLLMRRPGAQESSAWVVEDRYGSDHHPVIGVVPLTPATPSAPER